MTTDQQQGIQNQINYANQARSEFMAGQGSNILSGMGSAALSGGATGFVYGLDAGAELRFAADRSDPWRAAPRGIVGATVSAAGAALTVDPNKSGPHIAIIIRFRFCHGLNPPLQAISKVQLGRIVVSKRK